MTTQLPALGLALTDEADVVALAQAGDQRAFAELVKRRHSGIRSLLRRLSHQASLADDLAQETFLQAWRQLHGLRANGAFGVWLRQIAVSLWLQYLRKNQDFARLHEGMVGAYGHIRERNRPRCPHLHISRPTRGCAWCSLTTKA